MTQTNRLWVIGTVTVMIALVVAGWFLGVQPFLTAAAAADSERAAVEAQNATTQITLAELEKANKDLPSLEKEFSALQASIPSTSDTSPFITGLDSLAQSSGVQLTGFTVSDPIAYTVPASAVAPVAEPTAEGDADAPVVAAPTGPVAPTAVTDPLITPSNFVGIGVSIELHGAYDSVLAFVRGLQTDDRLFLVTGIASASDPEGGEANVVTATVSGLIYVIKPAVS